MSFTALHTAIMSLPHSGARGFEGFVADMLSEVTGLAFTTQKSGAQSGTDALASTFTVGVEGKQYKESTGLGLDALKMKIVDAASTHPSLELWILAATRSIDPLDEKALRELAASFGMEALVLAWNVGPTRIPRLAVLCALAPHALAAHLGNDTAIAADVAHIVRDPGFAAQSRLVTDELTAADIGYSATRAALALWNRTQMADARTARLQFDSEANVLAPGNHRVGRPKISDAIEQWWSSSEPVGALLGEEGMGKTWAALGWWADRSDLVWTPLCVIIPARDVDSHDGPKLVAMALLKATRRRDLAFWEKRLQRWSAGGQGLKVLVIIDGLNQKWAQTRWSEVALSLTAGEWNGRARLLLTCRPDHWEGRLRNLASFKPAPKPVPVERFDDEELKDLLSSYKIDRAWDPAIRELMRVPRLCHVAIRRHDELAATGDITIERLIYEDWRHRSASAQAAWSEAEFHDFIVGLAETLRASARDGTQTRKELVARVTQSSGSNSTDAPPILSELIDGGWMESTGKPHELKVRKERVPPVLGLALLNELKGTSDQEEAEMLIAAALEPYQGNDISTTILRYAASFSLMDTSASDHVRVALIKRWLVSQNFRNADFIALWPLVGANPDVVLDCVEQIWFGANPQGREDEVIVKSLANAVKWPIVADALDARLTNWLSRYWLDPKIGAVIGKVEDDDAAKARRQGTAERTRAWQEAGGPAASGIMPRIANDASWGRARAIELLSWLPRARFITPIKAWAITSALLGPPTPNHRMDWVLRWNEEDQVAAEAAVLRLANELVAHSHGVSLSAAALLLRALATPAAMRLLAAYPPASRPISVFSFDSVEVRGNRINWDYSAASASPRAEDDPLEAARGLIPFCTDPELALGQEEIAAMRALAVRGGDRSVCRLGEDAALRQTNELPFARWTPGELAAIIRLQFKFPIPLGLPVKSPADRCATGASRRGFLGRIWGWIRTTNSAEPQEAPPPVAVPGSFDANPLAIKRAGDLPNAAALLDEEGLAPWRALAREQRLHYLENREPIPALHAVSLVGLTADQQVAALLDWPLGPPATLPLAEVLRPLAVDQFEVIANRLGPEEPDEQLLNWLSLLAEIELGAMPSGWSVIAVLFAHVSTRVRAAAMRVAFNAGDRVLADLHEASDWACPPYAKPRDADDEGAYGSLLLAHSSRAANDPAIASRVHGEVLGKLAEDYPAQSAYRDAFAAYVEAEIDFRFTAKEQSFPRSLLSNIRGWEDFAANQPERLKAALAPLIDGHSKSLPLFMMEQFPLFDAVDALAIFEPVAAAHIIERELRSQLSGNMRSGDLFSAAMRLPEPEGDGARDLLYNEANDDAKLQDLASRAFRHKRLGWLTARIERDLGSNVPAFVARGMAVASCLPHVPRANALWDGALLVPPPGGWLAEIHETAGRRFKRYGHAQHWFDAFAAATEPESMIAAHRLFAATVDSRVYESETLRPNPEQLRSWSPHKQAHWHWGWKAVKATVERDKSQLKKTLLFTPSPGHAQHPKLR